MTSGLSSEDAPLLLHDERPYRQSSVSVAAEDVDDDCFDRFSPKRKVAIHAMASWCGALPMLISGSFVPLVPQVARDLDTTGTVVTLCISLSVFARALGDLTGGSLSSYYGRRTAYVWLLSLQCVGSMGVALSRTVPQLMVWRFVQSFAASPGIVIGPSVIGDVYKLEVRGTAVGLFFAVTLVGLTVAPLLGGFAAYYSSWRTMQWALVLAAVIALSCILAFFPETIHRSRSKADKTDDAADEANKRRQFFNPFSSLSLLRIPIVLVLTVATFFIVLTDYTMTTPIPYTIGMKYGIRNELMLGFCCLPNGLGDIIGAPLAGRLSDRIIVRLRARRKGVWYPEDRLRVAVFAAATIVPFSTLGFGLFNHFVPGMLGLTLNLVCLFLNGLGNQMVTGPCAAYIVDVMGLRSAECFAVLVSSCLAMISIALSGVLPLIHTIGTASAYSIFAMLAWVGFGLFWYIVRCGDHLRKWSNVTL